MIALNIICAICWTINAAFAFARAQEQHTNRNHGWASDAFWYGLVSVLLSLDAVSRTLTRADQ